LSPLANKPAKIHWLSVVQFGGSAFAMVILWTAALGIALYSLFQFALAPHESEGTANILLSGAGMLWVGILLIPSVIISFARLINRPVPPLKFLPSLSKKIFGLTFLLLPPTVLLGEMVLERNLPLLLLPLHVLAASLSVAWLLWLALRNLDLGGAQRRWGAFASGLTAGPLIATVLEFIAVLVVLVAVIIYVSLNQQLSGPVNGLLQSLRSLTSSPQSDPSIQTFTNDPVIAVFLLANLSLFVPLIEELAKPIAIWFLMWGRALTSAQGFGLGMLSGAGFALAENLFSGASITGWADTTFVRIGATAFHLATAGLMGWALVRARGQRRYLALAGVYVFNIFIHGLWNTVVVLGAVSPEATSSLPFQLPNLAGYLLVSLTLLSIGIIIVMNKRLQPVNIRRSVVKKARSIAKIRR
jgi:hypothetical protein